MTKPYRRQADSQALEQPPHNAPGAGFQALIPNPKLTLLDQVREVMRLPHYSIRTERCYGDWVRRYVKFHHMTSRADRAGAEPKIELFLSQLAVESNVAVSTQNQAFNALLFSYQHVLHQELGNIRADAGSPTFLRFLRDLL